MSDIAEKVIKKRTFSDKTYERLVKETILRELPPFLDRDKIAIDVGGNVGHISMFLSDYCKEVLSYEAVDVVFNKLKNLERIKTNIKVKNAAISNFCGDAEFFVDHLRLSNSSLQDLSDIETSFKKKTKFSTKKVRVITLDSLKRKDVGFVKIDVEGTELDVLKGAKKTINRCRPNFLIEIYEPFSKHPIESIFEFLMSKDYSCYYFDPESGLVEVRSIREGVDVVRTKHHLHDGDFLFIS